ncbi:hypothetical protein MY4824_005604 [Beauveria thailandica]
MPRWPLGVPERTLRSEGTPVSQIDCAPLGDKRYNNNNNKFFTTKSHLQFFTAATFLIPSEHSEVHTLTSLAIGLVRANVAENDARLLCGNLGVMEVADGVDTKSVRTCKEHPSIRDIQDVRKLQKRKC